MTEKELERRATALALALGEALDAPDDVLARAMGRFPDIIHRELWSLVLDLSVELARGRGVKG